MDWEGQGFLIFWVSYVLVVECEVPWLFREVASSEEGLWSSRIRFSESQVSACTLRLCVHGLGGGNHHAFADPQQMSGCKSIPRVPNYSCLLPTSLTNAARPLSPFIALTVPWMALGDLALLGSKRAAYQRRHIFS